MDSERGLGYRRGLGRLVLVATAVLTIGLAAAPAALAKSGRPRVLPPSAHINGATYAEWNARWWQWALGAPTPVNPLLDQTGANCATGQSGHLWFLAGSVGGPVTRTCTVPFGTILFFPVVNWLCAAGPGDDPNPALQRQCASDFLAGSTGTAEIDGQPVQNLGSYFVDPLTAPVFSLTLPNDNILGAPAGTYAPAAAGGIYLMLAPLSPGAHLIHFEGSTGSGFTVDVTYHLIVQH